MPIYVGLLQALPLLPMRRNLFSRPRMTGSSPRSLGGTGVPRPKNAGRLPGAVTCPAAYLRAHRHQNPVRSDVTDRVPRTSVIGGRGCTALGNGVGVLGSRVCT